MPFNDLKKVMVDAIDDGRIVRVSEDYAIREGLPILRKKELSFVDNPQRKGAIEAQRKEMKKVNTFDSFRRPLRVKNDMILSSLIDNFHWVLSQKRKENNFTRKQLADSMGVKELDIKMIENGVLPSEDYILISKLEQFFKMSLRKDSSQIIPVRKEVESKQEVRKPKYHLNPKKDEVPLISSDDIEIDLEGQKLD